MTTPLLRQHLTNLPSQIVHHCCISLLEQVFDVKLRHMHDDIASIETNMRTNLPSPTVDRCRSLVSTDV
jgi:hypothetical protein